MTEKILDNLSLTNRNIEETTEEIKNLVSLQDDNDKTLDDVGRGVDDVYTRFTDCWVQNTELETQLSSVQQELDHLKDEIAKSRDEVDRLKAKISDLEAADAVSATNLEATKNLLNETYQRNTFLENQNDELGRENDRFKDLDGQITNLQSRIDNLEQDNQSLKADNDNLRKSSRPDDAKTISDLRESIRTLQDNLESLRNQNKSLLAENDGFRNQLEQKQLALTSTGNNVIQFRNQAAELSERLKRSGKENEARIEEIVARHQQETEDLQNKIRDHQQDDQELFKSIVDSINTLMGSTEVLRETTKQISGLNHQRNLKDVANKVTDVVEKMKKVALMKKLSSKQ
jgi:chromosome segregation ATPase